MSHDAQPQASLYIDGGFVEGEGEALAVGWPGLAGTVIDSIVLGSFVRHYIDLPGGKRVIVQEPSGLARRRPARGSRVIIGWEAGDARLLPTDPDFDDI
ncbi:TOBE domain-containing protein [Paracoccus sp. (in: a-proteobacteria)]|uniref:TOBE domain-containing protein n=1 Tax=Paracoccus sp. TaxID=267 RepID=UPI0028A67FE6|nr:TOBE domain-containing protein [Paracoccus sp. (in: a-proteobacteria)]